jgi:hypothetical protein
MKMLIVILSFGLLVIACNKSEQEEVETTNSENKLTTSLLRSSADTIPRSDAEFNIDKTLLEGNKWTFTISHSGRCDPNYRFLFYHKPKLTTDCVVDTIYVALKTNNNCKRLDYTTVQVNLDNYQICSQKIVFLGGTKVLEIKR